MIDRIVRQVQNKSELKYLSNVFAGTLNTGATQIVGYQVCGLAEGTENNQRVGRKVTLVNLQISFYCAPDATSTPFPNTSWDNGTLWVVQDKYPNGTPAAAGDVFDYSSGGIQYGLAFKNMQENPDRFSILLRKEWSYSVANQIMRPQFHQVNLNNLVVQYSGTSNGTGNIQKNGIIIFISANNPAIVGSTTGNTLYEINTQLHYHDS